ncbi:MAG: cyanophycin synthetase, partial [Patescibacteria group bacterium]
YSLKDKKLASLISKAIRIPGRHNISNFLGAFKLARHFGIKQKDILKAISAYNGSWRRMEYKGQFKIQSASWRTKFKAKVYDDYAHHPTEIRATLSALGEAYPASPLFCVFQPHQSKRLKVLFKEFTESFKDADITLILPIYFVAGRDVELSKWNSEALVKAIQKKYPKQKVFYLKDPKNLRNALQVLMSTFGDESCAPSSVVNRSVNRLGESVIVMMGAGDIVNITPSLLK